MGDGGSSITVVIMLCCCVLLIALSGGAYYYQNMPPSVQAHVKEPEPAPAPAPAPEPEPEPSEPSEPSEPETPETSGYDTMNLSAEDVETLQEKASDGDNVSFCAYKSANHNDHYKLLNISDVNATFGPTSDPFVEQLRTWMPKDNKENHEIVSGKSIKWRSVRFDLENNKPCAVTDKTGKLVSSSSYVTIKTGAKYLFHDPFQQTIVGKSGNSAKKANSLWHIKNHTDDEKFTITSSIAENNISEKLLTSDNDGGNSAFFIFKKGDKHAIVDKIVDETGENFSSLKPDLSWTTSGSYEDADIQYIWEIEVVDDPSVEFAHTYLPLPSGYQFGDPGKGLANTPGNIRTNTKIDGCAQECTNDLTCVGFNFDHKADSKCQIYYEDPTSFQQRVNSGAYYQET